MEDKLKRMYIGKNHEKIMDSKMNWAAAALGEAIGPIWFFYRKAPILGIFFMVVSYVVGTIAINIGVKRASFVMFFIYLNFANKLYLWDVERKVNKIMSNENLTEGEMMALAAKKGRTSSLAAVVYILAYIAFIVFYIKLYAYLMYSLMFK